MTFTHIADASDDNWDEDNIEEAWEEEEILETEEDDDEDLWLEAKEVEP